MSENQTPWTLQAEGQVAASRPSVVVDAPDLLPACYNAASLRSMGLSVRVYGLWRRWSAYWYCNLYPVRGCDSYYLLLHFYNRPHVR